MLSKFRIPTTREIFQLADSETGQAVLKAREIHGFFADQPLNRGRVTMSAALLEVGALPARLNNIELQVLDLSWSPAATYYIGDVDLIESVPSAQADRSDVVASFKGYCLPYPFAGEIWRRWVNGHPIASNEWWGSSPQWHASWLHVVQTAWFGAGREAARYTTNKVYYVDGSQMPTTSSFYLALGEAINGPGGYFGSGLSALEDCLRNAVAVSSFGLVWRNFEASQDSLGEGEVALIAELFGEYGVTLTRA
ncbi:MULTISPECIES: barstar family protein [unclassified Micromonospora]|uniref:barstar family protein n=1 Tax=unclassified Micromonospora TaxID=2617518 RepID=UPI002FF2D17B